MMKRIQNIEELIHRLLDFQAVKLCNELKIDSSSSESTQQVKKTLLRYYDQNTDNLIMSIEDKIINFYPIYEVQFTDEFREDILWRNREWIEIFIYLFELYGYNYFFDCIDESLILDPREYIDFFKKLNFYIDPDCGERFNSFFYYESKIKIDCLYQLEKRKDKIRDIKKRILNN